MSENPIPAAYLIAEGDRYKCTVCGDTVSKIFCDLGCDNCGGETFSENYESIRENLEDAIWNIENESTLKENEKEHLRGMIEEAYQEGKN